MMDGPFASVVFKKKAASLSLTTQNWCLFLVQINCVIRSCSMLQYVRRTRSHDCAREGTLRIESVLLPARFQIPLHLDIIWPGSWRGFNHRLYRQFVTNCRLHHVHPKLFKQQNKDENSAFQSLMNLTTRRNCQIFCKWFRSRMPKKTKIIWFPFNSSSFCSQII